MQHGGEGFQTKTERNCGYIEQAVVNRRQEMVFRVCEWGEVITHLTVKTLTYT
jgi:hypothetical protein